MDSDAYGLAAAPPGSITESTELRAAGELAIGGALGVASNIPASTNFEYNTRSIDGHQVSMPTPLDSEDFYTKLLFFMYAIPRTLHTPILANLMPVKEYGGDSLVARVTTIMYRTVALSPRPMGVPGRSATSTARAVMTALKRVGGSVNASKDHVATPAGKAHLTMQLRQLHDAIANTALLFALAAMVTSKQDAMSIVVDALQMTAGERARARDMSTLKVQNLVGTINKDTGSLLKITTFCNNLFRYYSSNMTRFMVMTSETKDALQLRPSIPTVPEITWPLSTKAYDPDAVGHTSDGSISIMIAPLLPTGMDGRLAQPLEAAANTPSFAVLPAGADHIRLYDCASQTMATLGVKAVLQSDPMFMAKDKTAATFMAAFVTYLLFVESHSMDEETGVVPANRDIEADAVCSLKTSMGCPDLSTKTSASLATLLTNFALDNTADLDTDAVKALPQFFKNSLLVALIAYDTSVENKRLARARLISTLCENTPAGDQARGLVGTLMVWLRWAFEGPAGLDPSFLSRRFETDSHDAGLAAESMLRATSMADHLNNAVVYASNVSEIPLSDMATPETSYLGSGWRCDVTSVNEALPFKCVTKASVTQRQWPMWSCAQSLLATGTGSTFAKARKNLLHFKAPHPVFLNGTQLCRMLNAAAKTELLGSSAASSDAVFNFRARVLDTWTSLNAQAFKGFAPVDIALVRSSLVVRSFCVLVAADAVGNLVLRLPLELGNTDAAASTGTTQFSVFMGALVSMPQNLFKVSHAHLLRDGMSHHSRNVTDTVKLLVSPGATFESKDLDAYMKAVKPAEGATYFAAGLVANVDRDRPIPVRIEDKTWVSKMDTESPYELSALVVSRLRDITENYMVKPLNRAVEIEDVTKWTDSRFGSGPVLFAQSESCVVGFQQAPSMLQAGAHFLGVTPSVAAAFASSGLPGSNGLEPYPNPLRIAAW
jgi:hypothetical protein